jgi:hypothetical protein
MIAQKRSSFLEWAIFLGLSICAMAISEAIGLQHPWKDGVVYTVVLFAAVGTAMRPAWGRKSFWTSLGLLFVLHTLLLLPVLHALPHRSFGILDVPVAGIEGVVIAGIVWNRTKSLRSTEPRS